MLIAIWGLAALAIAIALVAGVFLTFSDFVMRALVTSSATAGSEAMQRINRVVFRSVFMALFLGLAPVTLGAAVAGLWYGPAELHTALVAGAALYLVGVFLVTAAGNVPMNNRLDALPIGGPDALTYWPRYARAWTGWNHVRALAAGLAALCYLHGAIALALLQ